MSKYEVILCIINSGYSDNAMDVAKRFGATGGTVMHGRGTAPKEAEKMFNITIQPDKEIVMILVPSKIKDDILNGFYQEVGIDTKAQGIAFSLPVSNVIGLTENKIETKKI